jgi:hypothetical protein
MTDKPVVDRSHGHEWVDWNFRAGGTQVCRLCMTIRRSDDQNKPCKGPAKVRPRNDNVLGWEDE